MQKLQNFLCFYENMTKIKFSYKWAIIKETTRNVFTAWHDQIADLKQTLCGLLQNYAFKTGFD